MLAEKNSGTPRYYVLGGSLLSPQQHPGSGWLQGHNMDVAVETEQMVLLTEFTYDLEKSNAQTSNKVVN